MGLFDLFKKKKKQEIKINETLKETILSLQRNEIKININEYEKVKIEPDRTIVAIDGKTM